MDRLISEQAALEAVSKGCFELRGVYARCEEGIKAILSADLDLKQSFKDGYDTAFNDLKDRLEALLSNNPRYANAISDILQIINELQESEGRNDT